MKHRIIALLLVLCLCVGMVPTVFAAATLESSIDVTALQNHGLAIIRKLEANDRYDSVINTSSCVGMGIGGWIGSAACQLLKWIISANPSYSRQILGDELYYEVASTPITDSVSKMPPWNCYWKTRKFSSSEIAAAKALLSSSVGRQQQEALLRYYVLNEAQTGWTKYGIRSEAALLYYCTVQHHGGEGNAKKLVEEVRATLGLSSSDTISSLQLFHNALLTRAAQSSSSACYSNKAYQTKVYNYIVNVLGLPDGPAVGGGAPVIPFQDMPASSHWAYDAINWAYFHDPQITCGTSATTFSPDQTVTRGEALTFLWIAAGKPAPKTKTNPFRDVSSSNYFYQPVLWAVENGITCGTSADRFSPSDTVTRGQLLTFLWNYVGRITPGSSTNPYQDVPSDKYFCKPVLWAYHGGILVGNEGYSGNLVPGAGCSRAYVVTYLYNLFVLTAP